MIISRVTHEVSILLILSDIISVFNVPGSISHHHGVGKYKRKLYQAAVSPVGVELFRATKAQLDPNNVFGAGNIVDKLAETDLSGLNSKL